MEKATEKVRVRPGPETQLRGPINRWRSPTMDALRRISRDRLGVAGGVFLVTMGLMALLATYVAPYPPNEQDLLHTLAPPSAQHIMGTDQLGRDLFSRVIVGSRASLTAAAVCVVIIMTIGVLVGGISGFAGGTLDAVIMRIVDSLLALPKLIFAFAVVAVVGPGLMTLMVSLASVWWLSYARVIRGSVLSVKEQVYVDAARAVGAGPLHILVRHVLPNVISPIVIMSSLDIGTIILSISSLSFLGLGAQPPTAEWGMMLNEGRIYMTSAPHLMLFPGLMIFVVVLAANLMGDAIRNGLDPRFRV